MPPKKKPLDINVDDQDDEADVHDSTNPPFENEAVDEPFVNKSCKTVIKCNDLPAKSGWRFDGPILTGVSTSLQFSQVRRGPKSTRKALHGSSGGHG